jgi:hypothetical protein
MLNNVNLFIIALSISITHRILLIVLRVLLSRGLAEHEHPIHVCRPLQFVERICPRRSKCNSHQYEVHIKSKILNYLDSRY